jgi:hypothetical protein
MPQRCKACDHPQRDQIDSDIAANRSALKAMAQKYDLSIGNIWRHGKLHVPETLRAAAEARSSLAPTKILTRLEKLVQRLERALPDDSDNAPPSVQKLLAIVRELRPTLQLMGQISGEVPTAQTNALFVNLGVSGEAEIRRALEIVKQSEAPSLEQCRLEAVDLLKTVLRERPEWRDAVIGELSSGAFVLDDASDAVAALDQLGRNA